MDQFLINRAVNNDIRKMLKSINCLKPVVEDEPIAYIRLKEQEYVISESVKRNSSVITAHELEQYRKQHYTLELEEHTICWIDKLINIRVR